MIKRSGYELKDVNIVRNQTGFMVPHVTLGTYKQWIKPSS